MNKIKLLSGLGMVGILAMPAVGFAEENNAEVQVENVKSDESSQDVIVNEDNSKEEVNETAEKEAGNEGTDKELEDTDDKKSEEGNDAEEVEQAGDEDGVENGENNSGNEETILLNENEDGKVKVSTEVNKMSYVWASLFALITIGLIFGARKK